MLSLTSLLLHTNCLAILSSIIYCHGHDLQDWIDQKTLQPSYFEISTKNILRCERLCQYQEKCVAVTFDKKKRVCYMHESYNRPTEIGHAGRYLFKTLKQKVNDDKAGCDANTQLVLPSTKSDHGNCYNVKEKSCILYGSTFQVTRGMAIWWYNKEVFENTPLDACKKKCIEAVSYTCKSFDFVPANDKCYLQEVNSHDAPAAYGTYRTYDYYERDCVQRG